MPGEQTPTIAYSTPLTRRANAIVIRNDVRVGAGFAAGGAVLAGLGVWMWFEPSFLNHWWFLAIGGLMFIGGVILILDRRPRFVLDDIAFTDFKAGLGELQWSAIHAVRCAEWNNATYLYITIDNAA